MEMDKEEKSASRQSRRRSVVPMTPDVLRHKATSSRQNSRVTQGRAASRNENTRATSSDYRSNKWYANGYPALRVADKKIREIRARKEDLAMKKQKPVRKSRSYSRGRSVYFNKDDPTIPYYRSKSIDGSRSSIITFDPVVNEKNIIRLTYTGSLSRKNSAVSLSSRGSRRGSFSGRRGSGIVQKRVDSIVPHMRGSYTFDDLQTRIYQQIHKTYGEPEADLKNKQFFETLAQIQTDHLRMKKMNLNKSDRNFLENMFKEISNLKKETGKILRNSEHRYSTQFEFPSPVNDKIRSVPRGMDPESFLSKLPKSREKIRLKPIRNGGSNRKGDDYKYYKNYDQYERYSHQNYYKGSGNFQRAKEPENPSDMLKFLQQAERLLTAYNQDESMKGFQNERSDEYRKPQPREEDKLKPTKHENLCQPSSSVHTNKNVKYGRTSPLKQTARHTNAGFQSITPVYKRPEAFYDAREHMHFHNRANLVGHRLSEIKNSGSDRQKYSLSTLAT